MQQLETRLLAWASNRVGPAGSSLTRTGGLDPSPKQNSYLKFKFKFYGFIHWHQSQEYRTFFCYTIFTNARIENIHRRIFTNTRVRNIIGRP
jgi:hypothetical protein